MALQFSDDLRNARAGVIMPTIGADPVLRIRSGPPPATVDAPAAGLELAVIVLPANYLTAPAGGAVTLQGVWTGPGLVDGTAGHFRLEDATGTARIQGTVGVTAADLLIDDAAIVVGEPVTVRSFRLTEGNA